MGLAVESVGIKSLGITLVKFSGEFILCRLCKIVYAVVVTD